MCWKRKVDAKLSIWRQTGNFFYGFYQLKKPTQNETPQKTHQKLFKNVERSLSQFLREILQNSRQNLLKILSKIPEKTCSNFTRNLRQNSEESLTENVQKANRNRWRNLSKINQNLKTKFHSNFNSERNSLKTLERNSAEFTQESHESPCKKFSKILVKVSWKLKTDQKHEMKTCLKFTGNLRRNSKVNRSPLKANWNLN